METELCKLAYKYGTDKCPKLKHPYTPYYYEMFKDKKESIKKVLEMGVGNYKDMRHVDTIYDPGLKRTYHRGASLYMWRDFFPNAHIYGADIVPEALFGDERISTFYCDETKEEDIKNLIKETGSDIDIFIDDGSHKFHEQIFLCKTIMPLLKKDVIYVIEDVTKPERVIPSLSEYDVLMPHLPGRTRRDRLLILRNK
jgi:hypothetical protein